MPVEAQSTERLEVVFTSPHEEKKSLGSVSRSELEQWLKDGVAVSEDDQQFFADLFADQIRQGVHHASDFFFAQTGSFGELAVDCGLGQRFFLVSHVDFL